MSADAQQSREAANGPHASARQVMNGKAVHSVPAKSVINMESGFRHKLLCDGPTFSTGSACAYSCSFCYVPDLMRKSPHLNGIEEPHEKVVIRRAGAVEAMRKQLTDAKGRPKYLSADDTRVIYASPLVDVAANMELVRETVECCKVILELTNWQIRLLSKSNLLPRVAEGLADGYSGGDAKKRIIFGVSTGTLDDGLAKAFEEGTPLVSKRLASLHLLQDAGCRTFGMICPSLPQSDYVAFAEQMKEAIRADRCEHVWAEVLNARGESFERTYWSLAKAGHHLEAAQFKCVSTDKAAWESYGRATFEAHAALYSPAVIEGPAELHGAGREPIKGTATVKLPTKLRFLQYVSKETRDWWRAREADGAILL